MASPTATAVVYVDDCTDPDHFCPVCLEPFAAETTASRLTCCHKEICVSCHNTLNHNAAPSCPLCRATPLSLPPVSVIVLDDSDAESNLDPDDSDAGPAGNDSASSDSEMDDDDDDYYPGMAEPATVWPTRSAAA